LDSLSDVIKRLTTQCSAVNVIDSNIQLSSGKNLPFVNNQVLTVEKGSSEFGGGTFVCKELVYSYAMWVSVKFHHAVIQTYDAVVTGQLQMSQSDAEMLRLTRISPNTLKAITGNRSNNEVRKGYIGLTQGGYLVDAGEWVWKHNYQPTEKGLECVKAIKHGVLHFKPEYHEALMDTVASYRAQLTNNNTDLFLE
jgi:hypothetical protein